jgi:hypothetical protein
MRKHLPWRVCIQGPSLHCTESCARRNRFDCHFERSEKSHSRKHLQTLTYLRSLAALHRNMRAA